MYRNERVNPLSSTGRVTAAGSVRVYLGIETANNNATGTTGVGVDFAKDFPSNPSSFTFSNQSASGANTSASTWNLTTSGVGVYHAVTGSGVVYIYETLTVS